MRQLRTEAALAVLWGLPGIRTTARLRQAARAALKLAADEAAEETRALLAAGWAEHPVRRG